MSVFKKIKDVLFDIEEEEEVIPVKKEKPVVEENPIKEIKITKENTINDFDDTDVPKKNNNFNFPLDFEDDMPVRETSVKKENIKSYSDNNRRSFYDDDYDIPRRNKNDYIVKEPERKKEEVRDYSKYLQPKKEEKKIFTPSPVISPVYGVLNQNYTKDDVIVKTDIGVKTPSLDEVRKKVMSMFTDPNHIRVEDPGCVENNAVFTYLDAFCKDKEALEEMKAHYRRGGLGDVKVKRYLNDILQAELDPIRARRKELEQNPDYIYEVLKKGSEKARAVAAQTLSEVRDAMGIEYFKGMNF